MIITVAECPIFLDLKALCCHSPKIIHRGVKSGTACHIPRDVKFVLMDDLTRRATLVYECLCEWVNEKPMQNPLGTLSS